MQGLDLGQGSDAPTLAPGEKLAHRPRVGAPGMSRLPKSLPNCSSR
jgi:hypothetical protein